jgi:hypothetical protein
VRLPGNPTSREVCGVADADKPKSCDFIVLAATALVTQFLESFKEFPPRQKAASFTIDQVVEKLEAAITSHR